MIRNHWPHLLPSFKIYLGFETITGTQHIDDVSPIKFQQSLAFKY